jgi:hypothetical protein
MTETNDRCKKRVGPGAALISRGSTMTNGGAGVPARAAPFEFIGWQCVSEVLPDYRQGPNLQFSGIKTGTNRVSNPFRYVLIFVPCSRLDCL